MDDPKPAQPTVQNVPPAAAPPPPPPRPSKNNNKRPLDNNAHIQNSNYYKMRAVLKDLRPHFIVVLRTPDFQNCKATDEIQEKMKLLMDLYKEMTTETINLEECKNVPEDRPLSGEIQDGPGEQHQDVKSPEQPLPDRVDKPVFLGSISDKQQPEDGRIQGTYIVGGSAFGWNFITFPGNKAIYYGRTKESFHSANVVPN